MTEEKTGIDKLLTPEQSGHLYTLFAHPGWRVLKYLAEVAENDYSDEIIDSDYRKMDHEATVKDIIYRQGKRKGIRQFFWQVKQWREAKEAHLLTK